MNVFINILHKVFYQTEGGATCSVQKTICSLTTIAGVWLRHCRGLVRECDE